MLGFQFKKFVPHSCFLLSEARSCEKKLGAPRKPMVVIEVQEQEEQVKHSTRFLQEIVERRQAGSQSRFLDGSVSRCVAAKTVAAPITTVQVSLTVRNYLVRGK